MKTKTYRTIEGEKIAHFKARCVVCRFPLYVFENGSSGDPRGAIKGNNNYDPLVASEYGYEGADVPLCFDCANTNERYQIGLGIAKERWIEKC